MYTKKYKHYKNTLKCVSPNKDEMIAGGKGKIVTFWNTKTFKKEYTVECCNCTNLNGLIELPNHCVAVSGGLYTTIDIIDTKKYQQTKQIELKENLAIGYYNSSLRPLNSVNIHLF